MRALSDLELLSIWERGHRRPGVERAVLLAAESIETDEQAAADLCIGERNAAILRLRNANFGAQIDGRIDCPRCAEPLEFSFDSGRALSEMRAPETTEFPSGNSRFRLPTSRDLAAVAAAADARSAAHQLLRRCCLDGSGAAGCSDEVFADVERKMEALDPAADLRFGFVCSACGHSWTECLDVAAWCWHEVELGVGRLLDQVHRIANAYGWTESEILSLGETRRCAYLARCDT